MNAHDMTDRIVGIIERDGYVLVDGVEYPGNTGHDTGCFEVTDDSGKRFRVSITEVAK